MTWTYNNAPDTTTDAGKRDFVRWLVKDITASRPLVTDEAIAAALVTEGSVFRAAALCCEALADAESGESLSVGDLTISGTQTSYAALAKSLRARADTAVTPFVGGISVADKDTQEADTDRVTPAFTRTLFDNPEASQSPDQAST